MTREADSLTPRQARFVREYLARGNGKQAAIAAGYSPKTAESQASRLLSNAKVSAAVEAGRERLHEALDLSALDVLRELKRIAMADIRQAFTADGRLKPIHEIPEDVARVISGVEVEELFEGRGEERTQVGVLRKVKSWPKDRALELLGKYFKLYTDKQEVTGKGGGPVQAEVKAEVKHVVPDPERIAAIARLLARVGALSAGGGAAPVGSADGAKAD